MLRTVGHSRIAAILIARGFRSAGSQAEEGVLGILRLVAEFRSGAPRSGSHNGHGTNSMAHPPRPFGSITPWSVGRRMDPWQVPSADRSHGGSRRENRDRLSVRPVTSSLVPAWRPLQDASLPEKVRTVAILPQRHEYAIGQRAEVRREGPLRSTRADPLPMQSLVDRRRRRPSISKARRVAHGPGVREGLV